MLLVQLITQKANLCNDRKHVPFKPVINISTALEADDYP